MPEGVRQYIRSSFFGKIWTGAAGWGALLNHKSYVMMDVLDAEGGEDMHLILDRSAVDLVLDVWRNGCSHFTQLYCNADFRLLLRHACDFQQREILPEEYLHTLLHLGDMQQHSKDIVRNLGYISEVDLDRICGEVSVFLPEGIWRQIGGIRVVPFIGIGGLAIGDCIFVDPSPCKWFPADGSNRESYLENYVHPTLRHELHHIGYSRIRLSPPVSEISTLGELAEDFALQIQMEGGAMLCQKQQGMVPLAETQRQQTLRVLTGYKETIEGWRNAENQSVDNASMATYFSLWENEKPVYWLGERICSLLIQQGVAKSVGDCMLLDPLTMIGTACAVLQRQEA